MFATALRLLDKSIRWIARSLRIEQVSLLVRTEISMSWRAPQPRVGSVGERPSVWISQPGTEGRRRTLSPVDLHGLESIGSSAGLALAEVIRNVRVVRVTDGFNDSPA